jgi:putative membrane protein
MSQPNIALGKTLDRYAIALTVIVLIAVPCMHFLPKPLAGELPAWISSLPLANAVLNSLATFCLLLSLFFIKRKDIANHQRMNITAMTLSALFLVLYIIYHTFSDPTRFGDADHSGIVDVAEKAAVAGWRTIYLTILNTHILAAAVIFPFILFTWLHDASRSTPQNGAFYLSALALRNHHWSALLFAFDAVL